MPEPKVTTPRLPYWSPCVWVPEHPIRWTQISIQIKREEETVFAGNIHVNRMKRNLPELASRFVRETPLSRMGFS
ncbi:MAG: hypothetical protein IPO07_24730 [Haliscomenobacter sp.]|nr:hypothetical protein [Haliscomenobacter sp.]MBK9491645.1 hypothetical protein [Haliscomenobacter sp.]